LSHRQKIIVARVITKSETGNLPLAKVIKADYQGAKKEKSRIYRDFSKLFKRVFY
jgi:hypothetical protein